MIAIATGHPNPPVQNPHDAQALSLLINFSIAKGAGVHLINDQLAYRGEATKRQLD